MVTKMTVSMRTSFPAEPIRRRCLRTAVSAPPDNPGPSLRRRNEKRVDFKGNIVWKQKPAASPDEFGGGLKINGRSLLQPFRR